MLLRFNGDNLSNRTYEGAKRLVFCLTSLSKKFRKKLNVVQEFTLNDVRLVFQLSNYNYLIISTLLRNTKFIAHHNNQALGG